MQQQPRTFSQNFTFPVQQLQQKSTLHTDKQNYRLPSCKCKKKKKNENKNKSQAHKIISVLL